MLGKRIVRWARTALLAALVPCAGCCGFWERHCGFQTHQQPVLYGAPGCCCPCPQQTGFAPAPVPATGYVPTNGPCAPCR